MRRRQEEAEAQNTIERAETRTRVIQRKLRAVERSDSFELIEAGQPQDYEIEDALVLIEANEED
jgi:hypothetical protein